MPTSLNNIFKNADLKQYGKTVTSLMSLTFNINKKTGAKIARAVLDDGTTLIKTVTASGVVQESITKLPEITSKMQRNKVIKELANSKIKQEDIAAMLNISQATVSNVLKSAKK